MKMCKWFPLQLFVTGGSEDARAELNVGSSLFHPSESQRVSVDNRNYPLPLLMHILQVLLRGPVTS